MGAGCTLATECDACTVTCRKYRKDIRVGSLGHHLADLHKIYQGQVVAKEILNWREGVVYKVIERHGKLICPFTLCTGKLIGGWMMRWHLCDLHPLDYITILREGRYPWCLRCGMQVDP